MLTYEANQERKQDTRRGGYPLQFWTSKIGFVTENPLNSNGLKAQGDERWHKKLNN